MPAPVVAAAPELLIDRLDGLDATPAPEEMIQTAETVVGNLTNLAIGAAVLIAIGMILWSWLVKRTVSAVIGVIILAAIVLFAINATDWLQNKVAEDVGDLAPHAN